MRHIAYIFAPMAKRTETLSEKIIAFMAKHDMSKTVLSLKALNNPHIVIDLLDGRRRPTDESKEKLEQFMASYRSEAA